MNKEYIITVFSENKVGLLSQITTVFTCRDINIESLTTSESSIPGIHKFTIVVITDPERNWSSRSKRKSMYWKPLFSPRMKWYNRKSHFTKSPGATVSKNWYATTMYGYWKSVTIISYWKRLDTKRIPSLCSNYYNPMEYSNSSGRAKSRSSNQNANYWMNIYRNGKIRRKRKQPGSRTK